MEMDSIISGLPWNAKRNNWQNIGGQLIPENELNSLLTDIKQNSIKSWNEVHHFYKRNSGLYSEQKLQHAYASLLELFDITPKDFNDQFFKETTERALETKQWMVKSIYESRAKDYESEFRKMNYDSMEEMEEVLGKLDDNVFIQNQEEEISSFRSQIDAVFTRFQLK